MTPKKNRVRTAGTTSKQQERQPTEAARLLARPAKEISSESPCPQSETAQKHRREPEAGNKNITMQSEGEKRQRVRNRGKERERERAFSIHCGFGDRLDSNSLSHYCTHKSVMEACDGAIHCFKGSESLSLRTGARCLHYESH